MKVILMMCKGARMAEMGMFLDELQKLKESNSENWRENIDKLIQKISKEIDDTLEDMARN